MVIWNGFKCDGWCVVEYYLKNMINRFILFFYCSFGRIYDLDNFMVGWGYIIEKGGEEIYFID